MFNKLRLALAITLSLLVVPGIFSMEKSKDKLKCVYCEKNIFDERSLDKNIDLKMEMDLHIENICEKSPNAVNRNKEKCKCPYCESILEGQIRRHIVKTCEKSHYAKDRVKFKCTFCNEDFNRKWNRDNHSKGCKKNKDRIKWYCMFCYRDFNRKCSRDNHIRNICKKNPNSKKNLRKKVLRPISLILEEENNQDSLVVFGISSVEKSSGEDVLSNKKQKLKCNFCKKNIFNKKYLSKDVDLKMEMDLHIENVCEKSPNAANRNKEKRKCPYCESILEGQIRRHIKVDCRKSHYAENRKKWACPLLCGVLFKRKFSIKEHLKLSCKKNPRSEKNLKGKTLVPISLILEDDELDFNHIAPIRQSNQVSAGRFGAVNERKRKRDEDVVIVEDSQEENLEPKKKRRRIEETERDSEVKRDIENNLKKKLKSILLEEDENGETCFCIGAKKIEKKKVAKKKKVVRKKRKKRDLFEDVNWD